MQLHESMFYHISHLLFAIIYWTKANYDRGLGWGMYLVVYCGIPFQDFLVDSLSGSFIHILKSSMLNLVTLKLFTSI